MNLVEQMNRVNRMLFDRIKQQYEITKMASAYILAERQIIATSENGMADGIIIHEQPKYNPEEYAHWEIQADGSAKQLTVKDIQRSKLEQERDELEELGRQLLDQEKYELLAECKEMYDKVVEQINNLK